MTFLSDTRRPEVDFLQSWAVILEEILGEIVSLRVKTLSNANLVASRHIKREKSPFPVDMHRPKRCCLNSLLFGATDLK